MERILSGCSLHMVLAQFKERMIQRKCSTTAGKETNKCKRQKVVVGVYRCNNNCNGPL